MFFCLQTTQTGSLIRTMLSLVAGAGLDSGRFIIRFIINNSSSQTERSQPEQLAWQKWDANNLLTS